MMKLIPRTKRLLIPAVLVGVALLSGGGYVAAQLLSSSPTPSVEQVVVAPEISQPIAVAPVVESQTESLAVETQTAQLPPEPTPQPAPTPEPAPEIDTNTAVKNLLEQEGTAKNWDSAKIYAQTHCILSGKIDQLVSEGLNHEQILSQIKSIFIDGKPTTDGTRVYAYYDGPGSCRLLTTVQ